MQFKWRVCSDRVAEKSRDTCKYTGRYINAMPDDSNECLIRRVLSTYFLMYWIRS